MSKLEISVYALAASLWCLWMSSGSGPWMFGAVFMGALSAILVLEDIRENS